jgi:hypothetical protein
MITATTATVTHEVSSWTAASWRAHVAPFHPAHAAASFALHRAEMGRLAPSAKVITALTMVGKRYGKMDREPLDYDAALQRIDAACARRALGAAPAPVVGAVQPSHG